MISNTSLKYNQASSSTHCALSLENFYHLLVIFTIANFINTTSLLLLNQEVEHHKQNLKYYASLVVNLAPILTITKSTIEGNFK